MSDSRRSDAPAGFQWHECTIFVAVLGILVMVVCNLFGSARHAEAVDEQRFEVQVACQKILDEIRTSMIGAVPVVRALAAEPSGWFQKLGTQAAARPIASTRLPRPSSEESFGKESAAASRTGNAILFARPSRRVLIRGSDGRAHRIRTYRLVCYYLTKSGAGPRRGSGDGLNLARYVSTRVADAADFEAVVESADREKILRGLAAGTGGSRVRWLWRRAAPAASGVLGIDPRTGAVRTGLRLPVDPALSQPALLPFDRFSVATNFADDSIGVARLARRSSVRGGFPHGFEAQFAGSASARQVALHLTLIGTGSGEAPVSADLRSIAVVRDR